jgi:2-amino-4-hydroxy-6-hydroxymethyldihydropteridine diphosphokinase
LQASSDSDATSHALIALGANLPGGDRAPAETLTFALDLIAKTVGTDVMASSLFRTPAFPPGSGPDYLNAAARFRWSGSPEALLTLLNRIEKRLGRTRGARWEARIVDLDLIALGDRVRPDAVTQGHWTALPPARAAVETPHHLILPHPRMAERSFVLGPLAEIAPGWRHPLTGLSVADMLAARPAAERAQIVPVPWPGTRAPSPLSFGPVDDM